VTVRASHTEITDTAIATAAEIARLMRRSEPGKQAVLDLFALLARHVVFEAATLFLLNADGSELEEVATHGRTVNVLEFLQFGPGSGLAGWTAGRRQPLYIPGRSPEKSGVHEFHDSVMILPLVHGDDMLGVLSFSHSAPDAFSASQRAILELAAELVAFSLERIVHYREQERLRRQLATASETAGGGEQAPGILAAITDVTSAVSEEIDQPLSVIVGNAQIIELEVDALPQEISRRVRAIVDSAKQISLITHQLQKIKRLMPGGVTDEVHTDSITHEQSTGESS
jgi:GAF domain-containing protein